MTSAALPLSGWATTRALCTDLDGTLISTDLLWESLLSAVRRRPWVLLWVPLWLLRGRPILKHELARASNVDFATLPYRPAVLQLLTDAHRDGRRVVLATASDRLLADGVAAHLGCFHEVHGSDGITNLKGSAKAALLLERFGAKNYDYIGDSRADVPCWRSAHDALCVGPVPDRTLTQVKTIDGVVSDRASQGRLLLRALRPHQWLKNLLLAVPAVAAHAFAIPVLAPLALAMVSLSLCASGGYVLNDLLDLTADRRHPRKRRRPFAAGLLPLAVGVAALAACWIAGFGIAAAFLPPQFLFITAFYVVSTASYSLWLKQEPVLDVMFLAGLYVVRVVGGGYATGVPVSNWLLAFTLFICLALAFQKRFVEARAQADAHARIPGRGYTSDDLRLLESAGLTSAYLSSLVLALYVNSTDVTRLYAHPDRLLLMCPVLLYWSTRSWLAASRGQMHDDPLVAVTSDPITYVLLVLSIAIVVVAA